jgi:cytochrome c oxidase assembly factor CtaG
MTLGKHRPAMIDRIARVTLLAMRRVELLTFGLVMVFAAPVSGHMEKLLTTTVQADLWCWIFADWAVPFLLLTGLIYARGWRRLYRHDPRRFSVPRLAFFSAGLTTLFIVISSPLDAFAARLLTIHMLQHIGFMMVAAPLLLLGTPYLPLLCGLPRPLMKYGLGPLLAWPVAQRIGHCLTHPLVCWLAFVVTTLTWHMPAFYETALQSPFWHRFEHVCFLGTALLFWWPVIQPWPSLPHWTRWAMIPYLFLADFQNTALSAFLTFYGDVLYPTYANTPRIWNMSALDDQASAGATMWVLGSVAFLIPVALIAIGLMNRRNSVARLPAMAPSPLVVQASEPGVTVE